MLLRLGTGTVVIPPNPGTGTVVIPTNPGTGTVVISNPSAIRKLSRVLRYRPTRYTRLNNEHRQTTIRRVTPCPDAHDTHASTWFLIFSDRSNSS